MIILHSSFCHHRRRFHFRFRFRFKNNRHSNFFSHQHRSNEHISCHFRFFSRCHSKTFVRFAKIQKIQKIVYFWRFRNDQIFYDNVSNNRKNCQIRLFFSNFSIQYNEEFFIRRCRELIARICETIRHRKISNFTINFNKIIKLNIQSYVFNLLHSFFSKC